MFPRTCGRSISLHSKSSISCLSTGTQHPFRTSRCCSRISSPRATNTPPPSIRNEKLLTFMEGQSLTFDSLRSALEKLDRFRVHVVGDTIVDSHTQTAMIGGHAKTPTMSGLYERRDDYIGGGRSVSKQPARG